MKQLDRHPVRDKMTQKGKQTLHFLCFMSDINVLRKLLKKIKQKKKKKKKQKKKTGNYIQLPIDIGVCGVNLRPPNSRILAELVFACGRCTERYRKTW